MLTRDNNPQYTHYVMDFYYSFNKKLFRKLQDSNARLTAIFQDKLCLPVPECLHSGFYCS